MPLNNLSIGLSAQDSEKDISSLQVERKPLNQGGHESLGPFTM